MKESKEKIKGSVKQNINLMQTPLMAILPGQISFFVILSIIPLASLLVMLISKLSLNFDFVTNFITHYIPGSIANIILGIFEEQKAGAIDVFFIAMALYLASKATHSIIVASTEIYNGEQRDFIRTRIKAIVILIILIMLVVGLVAILTFGGRFLIYLSEINGDVYYYFNMIYQLIKWPFVFFMIFFVIKVIYTVAPNVSIPSSSVNKGALLTAIVCEKLENGTFVGKDINSNSLGYINICILILCY